MKVSIITATYNRAEKLSAIALPSLRNQTDRDFEWVVINDGSNLQTREIIRIVDADFPIVYLEIAHPNSGFGLCHARNLGIETATGELISYLDDDNSLQAAFIASTKQFFMANPQTRYSMASMNRRRDVTINGKIIRQGKEFRCPSRPDCSLKELINLTEIFDSNGFTHYRNNCPSWNPDFRVFADYEYLLQCTNSWKRNAFKLQPQVLVNYIQSTEGIIGSSTYDQWAEEISKIINNHQFYSLSTHEVERLILMAKTYQSKTNRHAPAFG
jgi:glycosyltransferase involved in cell wall biosynthesis